MAPSRPADRAAGIAVATVKDFLAAAPEIEKVVFACFGPASAAAHERAMRGLGL
ncbi:MAG TPA: hypothetical protein VG758_03645 [Hyphomicrobiaceae bacterium]|nr:hypothetical protein [Hyphomicrobiaceae bacterium]